MKHNYTDAQLESALNKVTPIPASSHHVDTLKAALEALPEPTPPVVDGKTPGEVNHDAVANGDYDTYKKWSELSERGKRDVERGASAVLAAFGGASLDAAIARMEAIPFKELDTAFLSTLDYRASIERIRAHLIAAARGLINLEAAVGATPGSFAKTCDDPKTGELPVWIDSKCGCERSPDCKGTPCPECQPAEIPWKEWHGGECPLKDEEVEEWDCKLRNGKEPHTKYSKGKPSDLRWTHKADDDIIAYRVLKWREGFGPDAVDWKAKYEALLSASQSLRSDWRTRAEKAEAELQKFKDSIAVMFPQTAEQWDKRWKMQDDYDHLSKRFKDALAKREDLEAELAQWKNDHAFQVQQWQEMRERAERADIKLKHYEDSFADLENAIKGWNEVSDEPLEDNIRRLVLKYGEAKAELAFLKNCGVVELAACNANVDSFIREWGARLKKAEDKVEEYEHEKSMKEPALSRLRPLSEAGPVPEGAMRYYFEERPNGVFTKFVDSNATHYADIYPPGASQPAVEAEPADPYAELKAAHAAGKVIEWKFKDASEWMTKTTNFDRYPDNCEYRIKPEPATFEAHGKTWIKLVDRNPPCESHKLVNVMCTGDDEYRANILCKANDVTWRDEAILGWRYADEPTPEPLDAKPWTPAVGDKVQLKGGSFTMTVEQADSDGIACEWHDSNGVPQARTYTSATLQPA